MTASRPDERLLARLRSRTAAGCAASGHRPAPDRGAASDRRPTADRPALTRHPSVPPPGTGRAPAGAPSPPPGSLPAVPIRHVDLAAVAANTRLLSERAGGAVMAVVKADGFGHGAAAVARTALAHGARSLGVTSIDEALALRRAGLTAPVLSWLNAPGADFAAALAADVQTAVPSGRLLAAVAAAAGRTGRRAVVHLHADVGMARDGAAPQQWARLCADAAAAERSGAVRVVGVMGHLGCADRADDPCDRDAAARYRAAVDVARAAGLRPRVRHLAATAAVLDAPATHFDLARVGAGLVGIDPTGRRRLRPALTVTAPVVGVRTVPAGSRVGYGHDHRVTRPSRLALLPLGYADGLPRTATGRAAVLLGGRRRPLVGLVSMDQVVVDVTDPPSAPGPAVRAGDRAVVLGPGRAGEPTAEDWARWSDTIPHEIVTGFGPRVRRFTEEYR
ncbi:alanine racemase [Streptomyces bohaiensis]|uniref:alanine racemase n=1 Tax=Streptomyces bohaiensis TaxID=1431344 RepID=UPI003B79A18D